MYLARFNRIYTLLIIIRIIIFPNYYVNIYAQSGSVDGLQTTNNVPDNFIFKSDVNLITMDVIIRNRKGGIIGGLNLDDFLVYSDGVIQQPTNFSCDQIPLAIALVIDRSASISPYIEKLKSSAKSALRHLKPQDQVVLFSFGNCCHRHTDLTEDHIIIEREIENIPSTRYGGTNINCAIFNASRYLFNKAGKMRRAIILISDNSSNMSPIHKNDVIKEVMESSVTVFSIQTAGGLPLSNKETETNSVKCYTHETGGEVLYLAYSGMLPDALDSVIMNLRLRYTLGFIHSHPGKVGTYHKLDVKLKKEVQCHNCTLQTRTGYFVVSQPISVNQDSFCKNENGCDCDRVITYLVESIPFGTKHSGRLLFNIKTDEFIDDGHKLLKIRFYISPKTIHIKADNNKYLSKMRIAIYLKDKTGNSYGEYWDTLEMKFNPEDYYKLLHSSMEHSISIPFQGANQIMRVVVYDLESQNIGLKDITIHSKYVKN